MGSGPQSSPIAAAPTIEGQAMILARSALSLSPKSGATMLTNLGAYCFLIWIGGHRRGICDRAEVSGDFACFCWQHIPHTIGSLTNPTHDSRPPRTGFSTPACRSLQKRQSDLALRFRLLLPRSPSRRFRRRRCDRVRHFHVNISLAVYGSEQTVCIARPIRVVECGLGLGSQ
jgi:hypothetical protein